MSILKGNLRRRGRPFWAGYSDEQLLDLRFCDLGLTLEGNGLQKLVRALYFELSERDLQLRPPCWLSSEWFAPYHEPGIAIPFYLAHPRLKRLERDQMKEVEGGTKRWCMQLLRHEAGHAYEVAYRVNHKRRWSEIFGRSSQPYPSYYRPKPQSKNFVLHLDWWYAQSHPVEDFAETFAVWLQPRARWRSRYEGWPALRKLKYVDELMAEIAGKPPLVKPGRPAEPIQCLRQTLREHYQKKQQLYGSENPSPYDRDLKRIFPPASNGKKHLSAAVFLRRVGSELQQHATSWNNEHAYASHLVLKGMMQRSSELGLRVSRPQGEIKKDAARLLSRQTRDYLYHKKFKLAL